MNHCFRGGDKIHRQQAQDRCDNAKGCKDIYDAAGCCNAPPPPFDWEGPA
jgi:hypothetical protein